MTTEPSPKDIEQLKSLGYEVIRETDGAWTCFLKDEPLTHAANATEISAWTEAAQHRDLVELIEDAERGLGEATGATSCGELENARFHLEYVADSLAEAVKRKPLPTEYTILLRAPDGLEISGTGPSIEALMQGIGYVTKDATIQELITERDALKSEIEAWRFHADAWGTDPDAVRRHIFQITRERDTLRERLASTKGEEA